MLSRKTREVHPEAAHSRGGGVAPRVKSSALGFCMNKPLLELKQIVFRLQANRIVPQRVGLWEQVGGSVSTSLVSPVQTLNIFVA